MWLALVGIIILLMVGRPKEVFGEALVRNSSSQDVFVSHDSAYWSQHWRDSVNEYQGRLLSYQLEVLSYGNAFLLSLVPLAAESFYTGHIGKGALFLFGRAISGIAALDGVLGITKGQGSSLKNVILVIAGVVGYVFFKVSEVSDVQHDVSTINESLVSKWNIATNDIDSSSIRYPKHDWPSWVTTRPPARSPESPLSVIHNEQAPKSLELRFSVPF
jgi:hypothetical protein